MSTSWSTSCKYDKIIITVVFFILVFVCCLYFATRVHTTENLIATQTYLRTEYPSIAEKSRTYPNIIEKLEENNPFVDKRTNGTLLRTSFSNVNKKANTFTSVRPQFLIGEEEKIPTQFNGHEIWKEYLSPITNQGSCGNCWAHSSAAVLADRFSILSLGKIKFNPSPYDMTVCGAYRVPGVKEKKEKNITLNDISEDDLKLMDDYFHGRKVNPENIKNDEPQTAACEGADLYSAAEILYTEGITTIECFPSSVDNGNGGILNINNINPGKSSLLPYCYKLTTKQFDTCPNKKTAMRKYRAKTIYNIGTEKDSLDVLEQAIMHEVYRNGPLTVGFMTYEDFMNESIYDGKTIYQYNKNTSGQNLGGHAVRLVGWGEEIVNGQLVPYWWIANSWGKDWGINGYFRIKRKIPECKLEQNTIGFLPDFPGMELTNKNIIPIESSNDIDIRNFIHSYLDPTSGFYVSAMNKVKECKLEGNITEYINKDKFPFPDYKTFFAGKIKEYTTKNPLPDIKDPPPFVKCEDKNSVSTTSSPVSTTSSPVSILVSGSSGENQVTTFTPDVEHSTSPTNVSVIDTFNETMFRIFIILCLCLGIYIIWYTKLYR